jgi:NADH-quinone oxidoreductase subunit C
MSAAELADRVARENPGCRVSERYGNQLELHSPAEQWVTTLSQLKAAGFEHLSNLACVDWIDQDEFELLANLWSHAQRVHVTVKTRVPREAPAVPTVRALWPQAQVYEREIHEFFGVDFPGNPELGPMFLHNWKDLPPLRKDFDTREYSRRAYGFLEEEQE